MSFLKGIVKNITLTLVAAFIGALVTTKVSDSYLEYRTSVADKYFGEGKELEELEIKHQGHKIENISVYTVYIWNRWFKDPENVKVFFKITEKGNKPVPPLIKKKVYLPYSLPQEIEIREIAQDKKNLYAFNIPVVQRTDSKEPYIARFIFEGTEAPNIKVSSPFNANVRIIPYADWIDLWPIIITVIVYSLIILIILSLSPFFFERDWPKIKSRFVNDLSRTKNLNLDEAAVDLIADVYKKEIKPKSVIQLIQGKKSNDDINLND